MGISIAKPVETPNSSSVVLNLLSELTKKSSQMKIRHFQFQGQQTLIQKRGLIYQPNYFLESNYSFQEPAPTSPFVANESTRMNYSLGASKLWKNGLKTQATYTLQDSETEFSSGTTFNFLNPTLEMSLETSLLRDFLGKKNSYYLDQIKEDQKIINFENRIEKKKILVGALLDFANLLEIKEELKLQKNLCQKTQSQFKKIAQKKTRGSVSTRLYLQSLKEYNNCRATIESIDKSFIERKDLFQANYNVSFDEYVAINSEKLYLEIIALYRQFNSQSNSINLDDQDDIKLVKMKLNSLKLKGLELSALQKANLNVQLKVGSSAAEDSFSDASSDMFSTEYPYVYAGLRLDLPLENRESAADAAANRYQLRATEFQKDLIIKQKEFRIQSLKKTMEKDLEIYDRYSETVNLADSVLKEAAKDYANGRIDYNDYSEFNKGLIQDQKKLSSHRIQVIVRIIEYLDYFSFFNSFTGERS